MRLKQWDIVKLKQETALEVSLGALHRHLYKGNYTRHALNWWQNPPSYFYTTWAVGESRLERIEACLCIVESIVNTPSHKGYLLLLSGEMLRQHPHLEKEWLEQSRVEENRLLRLLPYLLGKKREKSRGIYIFVPFEQAKKCLELCIPVDGRTPNNEEAIVWQKEYDDWFSWTVMLCHSELDSLLIKAELVYEPHCYLDMQGLKLNVSRPQIPEMLNFGAVREDVAQIQIYPRLPKGISQIPKNHHLASFEHPVIRTSYDAAQWQIALEIHKSDCLIKIRMFNLEVG